MHQKDQFLHKRQLSSDFEIHHSRRRQARNKQLLHQNAARAHFSEHFLSAGRGSHLFTCVHPHPCGVSTAAITLLQMGRLKHVTHVAPELGSSERDLRLRQSAGSGPWRRRGQKRAGVPTFRKREGAPRSPAGAGP